MKIIKTIEHPDGSYDINGTFSPEEVDVILEVGLNTLYQTGALPFKAMSHADAASFIPGTGSEN